MNPTPSVNDTKKKTVKAWAVVYKDNGEICTLVKNYLHLEIHKSKSSAARNKVEDPNEKIVPCTITYSI